MAKATEEKTIHHRAEVVAVQHVSPNMIRVRLGGAGLADFEGCVHGDERIRIAFPLEPHGEPPAPSWVDGVWGYHDERDRNQVRSYTVQHWDADAGEMNVDFVVHVGGVAATWAANTRVGDVVTVTGSDGWHQPPADMQWQLLIADMTGLPALERLVNELPAGVAAHVIVEVIEEADVREFPADVVASQQWIVGSGHGNSESALPQAVQAFVRPPGTGYVWFAAEAAPSRAVRKQVRSEWGMGPDYFTIIGYWKVNKDSWMARYRKVEKELATFCTEAIERGYTGSELMEVYDAELERRGL